MQGIRWVFVWSALVSAACATRVVRPEVAGASARSPAAAGPKRVVVVRALESDVPLPGESTEGWSGLEEGAR